MMKELPWLVTSFLFLLIALAACGPADEGATGEALADRKIRAVTTTNLLADLVRNIGGDRVEVASLMGPGVDPHLYQASAGDVDRMSEADVIFYNGLHLEGKMTDLFSQMRERGVAAYAVAEEAVAPELRLSSPDYPGNFDPHIWFDISLWIDAARFVGNALSALDSTHAATYESNTAAYLDSLSTLDEYVRRRAAELPEDQRVLITSHDAFGYFGRAYEFEVRGLQGISTATEAGTADVQALARYVAERRIPALFVESSVSPRGIEAVREAVRSRGFDVQVGGTLYGDALGAEGSGADTYVGMVRQNIATIVSALAGTSSSAQQAGGRMRSGEQE